MQKRLNQSICRWGFGFWWAEGSTGSIIFASWRQYAYMGWYILAPPGEYDLTVRLRRRSGLTSNYFDHLFSVGYWFVIAIRLDELGYIGLCIEMTYKWNKYKLRAYSYE